MPCRDHHSNNHANPLRNSIKRGFNHHWKIHIIKHNHENDIDTINTDNNALRVEGIVWNTVSIIKNKNINVLLLIFQWLILLIWFNFNPSMDK